MKIVAKCSAFSSLAYQVHIKVCNPVSLSIFCIFSAACTCQVPIVTLLLKAGKFLQGQSISLE